MPGYDIKLASQARALGSPLRQEVVDVLEATGPSTIASIAERLGRRPDTLYFHIRVLMKVGLLKHVGMQGEGRGEAAVYDLPGRPLRLVYGSTPAERQKRVGPTLDGLLRLARRDTKRALTRKDIVASGPARDLWVARARGWLTPEQLKRANVLLTELFDMFHTAAPKKGARPLALAFALTPLDTTP